MAAEFERLRDAIVASLAEFTGVTFVPPAGAFYVFPDIAGLFERAIDGRSVECGQDVAETLLETARFAVVPGKASGSRDHFRISFSCAMERIEGGMRRIGAAIA